MTEHTHDWIISKPNVQYRDEGGHKFIIDWYVCECGAGGKVVTPIALFEDGMKTLGITDD